MSRLTLPSVRPRMNRRAVLRGLFGASVGLPFLESLPDRSAWAADQKPVFSLFICAVEGIVPTAFFPNELGVLTAKDLAAAGKATSELSRHAEHLLFVKGINWVTGGIAEPHAETLVEAFTARTPTTGSKSVSTGPSADWIIAEKVQPGTPPLTLYAGNINNGYIEERLSFSKAGEVTAATDNPYKFYQQLVGLLGPGGTMTPEGEAAARLLAESRNSVHDLVRDELTTLMGNTRLSSADRQRLQQHFDSIRDLEVTMDDMGDELMKRCNADGLELDKIDAYQSLKYDKNGGVEDMARLHMSLVALAFACNYNRTATLQWGDGNDHSLYQVPSNLDRQWPFSYISHRAQSDGQVGMDEIAAQSHAEIDIVRMKTLAAGLDHFKARGLADQSFVLWVNQFSDGPSHSWRNVPHILYGNGGGYLRQGEYVDAGNVANNQMLNTLISTAIRDTGDTVEDFGEGTPGQLTAVLA
ncbi:MAG TPA: DUF1552 domain-containing protein [Polyangiaceae bacterium]|nr:DUF1552 domain-containing protein [Polyangiaceae bacterium]